MQKSVVIFTMSLRAITQLSSHDITLTMDSVAPSSPSATMTMAKGKKRVKRRSENGHSVSTGSSGGGGQILSVRPLPTVAVSSSVSCSLLPSCPSFCLVSMNLLEHFPMYHKMFPHFKEPI